jgi:hypothetical protein
MYSMIATACWTITLPCVEKSNIYRYFNVKILRSFFPQNDVCVPDLIILDEAERNEESSLKYFFSFYCF